MNGANMVATINWSEDINIDDTQISQITGDTTVPCVGVSAGAPDQCYAEFEEEVTLSISFGAAPNCITAVSDGAPACEQTFLLGG